MAFVGVISDLFSCGKPRRSQTRDETNPNSGEDASRVAVTSDPASGGDIRATAGSGSNNLHAQHETSAPHNALFDPFPKEEDANIIPAENNRPNDDITTNVRASSESNTVRDPEDVPKEAPRGRDERNNVGPSDGEVKGGKVWQIEQRFLVVTRPNTSDSAHLQDKTSEPQHQDDTRPAQAVTKDPEVQDTTPPPQSITEEDSDVERLEHPVAIQHADADSKSHEEDSVVTVSGSKEGPSAVASPESEIGDVEVVAEATRTQLLDLPAEIRSSIYDRMIEDAPIRMCRHDDPALAHSEDEPVRNHKRQFYNLTQVCQQLRREFLPVYEAKTEYIVDLWTQKANLVELASLKGSVMMDIDAACFDMAPIDLLPLIRYLARTRRMNCRFGSTEGVVFRSIESIVQQLNKLLPSNGNSQNWLTAVNGPMKRIDLHLFPHEDIRQYYRFRGAEPMLRIVYPAAATEGWMKQSHKSGGEYEAYLEKAGLDDLEMHVVVGHASRRTTNEGRMPLNWRLSYAGSRLSVEQAVRISGTWTR
ncbi:hypothetical protein CC86DRAFT_387205 [Ophiobolus disseminans]|uniref:F-box domain-containing protein n=1 Tax=Ophiobolus disseminans TaxID=1469910 RepID=A0A6A6ZJ33_9PLEO|nr:hypothetical protein CC86DRAFT_387205 [Ophiobolus disseminans]